MKIMTSREFQLDYCGKSGLISSVKDIYPTEYYWNRDGKWNAFFPKEGDLLTRQYSFFRKEIASAISAILELYLSGKIEVDEAAERMDQKKEFPKL